VKVYAGDWDHGSGAFYQSVRLAVLVRRHTLGECDERKLQKSKKNLALVSDFATFTPLIKSGNRLLEKDVDSPRWKNNL